MGAIAEAIADIQNRANNGYQATQERKHKEASDWYQEGAKIGFEALKKVDGDLARIADLIRDYWEPAHSLGCYRQADLRAPCCTDRCGYLLEFAARDEALRLCQLDSVEDTL